MIQTKEDLNLELRHDVALVIDKKIDEKLLTAISSDLQLLKFNCDIEHDEEKNWVLLIGLNNEDMMLQAAENENLMCKWTSLDPAKRERKNKKRQEQKSYLSHKIMEAEEKKPFKFENRMEFEGGDYNSILTEADKSRLFFVILD